WAVMLRRAATRITVAALVLVALSAGVFGMKRYVERDVAFPKAPPVVVLKNRPAWMTDFLAAQIAASVRPAGLHSAFDHQMLVDRVQRPPPQPGKPWGGADLAAGVEMVRSLYGRPYADQIVKVTVTNFGGRVDYREAQLVLGTKFGKEIRWGAPIAAKTFEVRP